MSGAAENRLGRGRNETDGLSGQARWGMMKDRQADVRRTEQLSVNPDLSFLEELAVTSLRENIARSEPRDPRTEGGTLPRLLALWEDIGGVQRSLGGLAWRGQVKCAPRGSKDYPWIML
ncbi:hypothetical protein Bbelb_090490 [Branchiostoma belcheri]|nr:hypothetical protein Bbelb_090490 [Branchiostoma belcheri]